MIYSLLVQDGIKPPAASTITAILARNEMLNSEESTKHSPLQRFEMANGLLCHPLTVIDDHSRFLIGLKACPYQHSRAVREHLKDIFSCYGLPERMLMDNGAIWKGFHTKLTSWLVRLGIQVVHGRIHHPQTQGKDERLHRTLKNELLIRQSFYDLGMQTPGSHYQPSSRTFTGSFPPIEYETGDILRKVDCLGKLQYQGRKFRIGKAFKKSVVALQPTEMDGVLNVFFFKQRIAQINLLADNP